MSLAITNNGYELAFPKLLKTSAIFAEVPNRITINK